MKLSDVRLFLIVLFTLVLITSGGRNLLQSSPQHKVINPRGMIKNDKCIDTLFCVLQFCDKAIFLRTIYFN
ncbi:hypothetical protein Hanom_Chr11g00970201 [Helianthus anomalus]